MKKVVELYALNLLVREVIVFLWSTIVYNIFIDTDVVPTGVSVPTGVTICSQLTIERGNSIFIVN